LRTHQNSPRAVEAFRDLRFPIAMYHANSLRDHSVAMYARAARDMRRAFEVSVATVSGVYEHCR
jgi:hypothetical protein